jgi:hypothetical protein
MANRDHLCMSRRIEVTPHRIARFRDDFPIQRDDRADRHFACFGRHGGKVERTAHRWR